jgi:sporulation protein YlmC with PRC-barrel domain
MEGYILRCFVGERRLSSMRGLGVYLADGRKVGIVHDTVIDEEDWQCSHLFVKDTPPELVEGGIHLAIPWKWVRGINDVVILRWFPATPIPKNP